MLSLVLLPLSPDTVRNFLPQGARLIISSKHRASIMVAAHRVNMPWRRAQGNRSKLFFATVARKSGLGSHKILNPFLRAYGRAGGSPLHISTGFCRFHKKENTAGTEINVYCWRLSHQSGNCRGDSVPRVDTADQSQQNPKMTNCRGEPPARPYARRGYAGRTQGEITLALTQGGITLICGRRRAPTVLLSSCRTKPDDAAG